MSEYEHARLRPNVHISVNPEVADYLRRRLPDVPIEYLPNGLDVAAFERHTRPVDVDLERPLFLAVGAILPYKRYHLTVRAVAGLPQGSLLILGEGDEELTVQLQALGMETLGAERFRLTSVSYDEMPGYYATCDVLTLASDSESFGMTYIEAMAHNKPVVTTRDRSREAIVGDAGILCDPQDIPAYTTALHLASVSDFGDRPRQRARRFDWPVVGPRYVQVIDRVLSDRSG
jgi:glycosyltransferase involved in cell wall biosynthesis